MIKSTLKLSRFFFCLAVAMGSLSVSAQQTYTVKDPELTFSIDVPEHWRVVDDGFTFALVPPIGGHQFLDFTYYETTETDLDRTFEFTVLARNEPEALNAEIIDRGGGLLNSVPAKWAILSLTLGEETYHRLVYLFIKHGQYFIFHGTAYPENMRFYRPLFEKAIRSIETVPTK